MGKGRATHASLRGGAPLLRAPTTPPSGLSFSVLAPLSPVPSSSVRTYARSPFARVYACTKHTSRASERESDSGWGAYSERPPLASGNVVAAKTPRKATTTTTTTRHEGGCASGRQLPPTVRRNPADAPSPSRLLASFGERMQTSPHDHHGTRSCGHVAANGEDLALAASVGLSRPLSPQPQKERPPEKPSFKGRACSSGPSRAKGKPRRVFIRRPRRAAC